MFMSFQIISKEIKMGFFERQNGIILSSLATFYQSNATVFLFKSKTYPPGTIFLASKHLQLWNKSLSNVTYTKTRLLCTSTGIQEDWLMQVRKPFGKNSSCWSATNPVESLWENSTSNGLQIRANSGKAPLQVAMWFSKFHKELKRKNKQARWI